MMKSFIETLGEICLVVLAGTRVEPNPRATSRHRSSGSSYRDRHMNKLVVAQTAPYVRAIPTINPGDAGKESKPEKFKARLQASD